MVIVQTPAAVIAFKYSLRDLISDIRTSGVRTAEIDAFCNKLQQVP